MVGAAVWRGTPWPAAVMANYACQVTHQEYTSRTQHDFVRRGLQDAQLAVAGVPVGSAARPSSNDLTAGAIAGITVAAAVVLLAVVVLVLWAAGRRCRPSPGSGDSLATKEPRFTGSEESTVCHRAPCVLPRSMHAAAPEFACNTHACDNDRTLRAVKRL